MTASNFCDEYMDLTWQLRRAGRRLAALSPTPDVRYYPEAVQISRL